MIASSAQRLTGQMDSILCLIPDRQKRYLFLFAHPDDDVLIAGTMRQILDVGAELQAVWVTAADSFGQGLLREAERARAMQLLGLPEEQCRHLRWPDLGLLADLDRYADKMAALIATLSPDVLCATAYEGGHPDHDAVNFLMYEGCYRAACPAQLFEYPLYNGAGPWYRWHWLINALPPDSNPPAQYNPLNRDQLQRKYQLMRAYRSQWKYMLFARLVSSPRKMMKCGEPYRSCPADRDHGQLPLLQRPNYERWFNAFLKTRFSDWQHAVARATQRPVRALLNTA